MLDRQRKTLEGRRERKGRMGGKRQTNRHLKQKAKQKIHGGKNREKGRLDDRMGEKKNSIEGAVSDN